MDHNHYHYPFLFKPNALDTHSPDCSPLNPWAKVTVGKRFQLSDHRCKSRVMTARVSPSEKGVTNTREGKTIISPVYKSNDPPQESRDDNPARLPGWLCPHPEKTVIYYYHCIVIMVLRWLPTKVVGLVFMATRSVQAPPEWQGQEACV